MTITAEQVFAERLEVETKAGAAAVGVKLSNNENTILDLLMNDVNRWYTMEEISRDVYFWHPDGGPETAYASIRVSISKLRKKIKPYGITIESKTGRGNSGYRLGLANV